LSTKQTKYLYIVLLCCATAWWLSIIAAPLFCHFHVSAPAAFIYFFFSKICHQTTARSFTIFGKQFAVCIRCFSIYTGFLLAIFVYPWFRSNIERLCRQKFILFASLMMIMLDVGLTFTPVWQGSACSRIFTGLSAGMIAAFFIIPGFLKLSK